MAAHDADLGGISRKPSRRVLTENCCDEPGIKLNVNGRERF